MQHILLYMTIPNGDAENLCAKLLDLKLIACANIMPAHKALYRWKGKIENHEQECAVIMKSTVERFDELEKAVVELHPYDVPCLVQLNIANGHEPFLRWIAEEVSS